MNKITQVNQERIDTLQRNLITDMKINKSYFNQNIDSIIKTINTTYKKPSSRSSYFSSLAMISKALGAQKAYQTFSALATALTQEHQKAKMTGRMNSHESKNIRSFVNYSIHREICYNDWMNDKTNLMNMYRSLIMSMTTLYPPLRMSDYLNIELCTTPPPNSSQKNYLLYDLKTSNKVSLVLNKPSKCTDKDRKKKAGTFLMNIILSTRIVDTIQQFPRKYLFSVEDKNNKLTIPMKASTLYSIMDSVYSNNIKVRLDYIRKSYESYVVKQHFSENTAFLEKISEKLFHDLDTARKYYSKSKIPNEPENSNYQTKMCFVDDKGLIIFDPSKDLEFEKFEYVVILVDEKEDSKEEVPEDSKEEVPEAPHTSHKVTSKNSVAVKKYLSKDENRKKHQARDYLAKLNKGIITNPNNNTLAKYNITFGGSKYVINHELVTN